MKTLFSIVNFFVKERVHIGILFGLTATPMHKQLCFSWQILLYVLQHDNKAKLTPPTANDMIEYQQAMATKHPLMDGIYALANGLKLQIQKLSNYFIQNAYYNGWCKTLLFLMYLYLLQMEQLSIILLTVLACDMTAHLHNTDCTSLQSRCLRLMVKVLL